MSNSTITLESDIYVVWFVTVLHVFVVVTTWIYMSIRTLGGSKVARGRGLLNLILTNIGALVYGTQSLLGVLDNSQRLAMLFVYVIGFPLMYLPTLLRSWRITCCLYKTWDWTLFGFRDPLNSPTRSRGTLWFVIRLVLLMIPGFLSMALLKVEYMVMLVTFSVYQGILILLTLAVGFSHWRMRAQLSAFDLDQSNWIIGYSICIFVFFIFDVVIYHVIDMTSHDLTYHIVSYIHDIAFIFLSCISTLPHLLAFVREHREQLQSDRRKQKIRETLVELNIVADVSSEATATDGEYRRIK